MQKKPSVIFVVGGPGAGKETICSMLVQKYKLEHFSIRDLLRAEIASGSTKGVEIQKIMSRGHLVQSETVVELIEATMRNRGWSKGNLFLIDGFPRTCEDFTYFQKHFLEEHEFSEQLHLTEYVLLELDVATMKQRCLGRAKKRADESTLKERAEFFYNETGKIIDVLKQHSSIDVIDAKGTIEKVFADTCKTIKQKFDDIREGDLLVETDVIVSPVQNDVLLTEFPEPLLHNEFIPKQEEQKNSMYSEIPNENPDERMSINLSPSQMFTNNDDFLLNEIMQDKKSKNFKFVSQFSMIPKVVEDDM